MVSAEVLLGRLNHARIQLVELVQTRLRQEASSTIDLDAWKAAGTVRERLLAISWPRAGVGVGALAAITGGLMFVFLFDRPDAYPPPEPTAREIALHQQSLRLAKVTPPPSLVEANKSWKAE